MAGLRQKFSYQLLHAFSQVIFPLVTYPYLTRTIGAEGLGIVGYVDYVSGLIITLTAFGIPFYGVREVAKLQKDEKSRQGLFRQLFTIHFVCSLVGVAVFIGFMKAGRSQEIPGTLLAAGCAAVVLPPFIADWYMQGIEAFRFTTLRSIVLRLLSLLALFLFVTSPDDVIVYFIITVAVQAAVALTNLLRIGIGNVGFKSDGIQQHIKPLWHFFLTTSAISIYVFFDVIILGWFGNEKAIGYYAIAIRIVKLSLVVVLSLNVILFPRITHLISNNDHQQVSVLIQKALQFLVVLTFPLGAGFFLLAPQIIGLLAGDGFLPAIPVLRILSILPFLVGFSNLCVYQVLLPFGREKLFLQSAVVTCIVSVAAHWSLASSFSESGTATATVLTEACMVALTAFFAARTFLFSFPVKLALQTTGALLPLLFFVLFCQQQFQHHLVILLLSAVPGILLYGAIQLFVFKNSLLKEAITGLRRQQKIVLSNG
jgi:O-antigen/teichoic acid export membrane protein